jgi:hypothetical protein
MFELAIWICPHPKAPNVKHDQSRYSIGTKMQLSKAKRDPFVL